MKKEIIVKQTHRYTLESNNMYNGQANIDEYSDYTRIKFIDCENATTVFYCFNSYMEIHRFGEATSELVLKPDCSTFNKIKSEFGTFEIEILTHKYTYNEDYICVEYDIENGNDDTDGYKIEVEVAEGKDEFN